MDIGYDARKTVEALKKQKNYNFILHTGDLPYAWKGQENKWDEWGRLVEPLSSKVPYMVTPGNHEDNYNFMSYKNRFSNITGVNSQSNNNLYYSFNYGHIHFISLSTEHPYYKNSRQYNWLVNDLKNVDRNKYPFIFVFTHKTP
jgi:predicted MPP superfamily phosphohydrolase